MTLRARMLAAPLLVTMLAASGCGASGVPHGQTPTSKETAAAALRPVQPAKPVWLDTLQMVSATSGWALLWTSNPNGNAPLELGRSTDGGRTWTELTPPAARAALTGGQAVLQAVSATSAWLTVAPGDGEQANGRTEIFGTRDGGQSWTRSAPVPGDEPIALDFVSPTKGWLLESLGAAMQQNPVRLYRTADAGLHWSLIAKTAPITSSAVSGSGLPVGCDKDGMAFASSRVGWITGYCNSLTEAVRVSSDGGSHWTTQAVPVPASACEPGGCEVPAPQFAGPATFLQVNAYPGPASLLVSRDLGQTWRVETLPAGAGPYPRVTFFGPADGIAVAAGTQGSIGADFYLTTDGGQTWTAVPQGRHFGQAGASFDFVSTAAGFAWVPGTASASVAARLFTTASSGRSWAAVTPVLR